MRFAIMILLLNFNTFSKDREPAQYSDQLQIVTKSLLKKENSKKLQIMNEFLSWMEDNNSEQIKLLISSDISDDLKKQINENRITYFYLKPLKDVFLDKNQIPTKPQCSKLIDDVKYNDQMGKPEQASLSDRGKSLIRLLTNFCMK